MQNALATLAKRIDAYARLLKLSKTGSLRWTAILAAFSELVQAPDTRPVADLGCGPGRITAYLPSLGVDALGIDLSPEMISVTHRTHHGLRFEEGRHPRRSRRQLVLTLDPRHLNRSPPACVQPRDGVPQ